MSKFLSQNGSGDIVEPIEDQMAEHKLLGK